jgi:release factor glutamine methyltransferase
MDRRNRKSKPVKVLCKIVLTIANAMKTDSRTLFQQLMRDLTLEESLYEKEAMIFWVLEHTLGLSRSEVLAGKEVTTVELPLREIIQRLNTQEPLQYILGESGFYGRKFLVEPGVLIPRPETELLVTAVIEHFKDHKGNVTVLDIATGSGSIAITLALELSNATIVATDVSPEALSIAKTNSDRLNARVEVHLHDILKDSLSYGPLNAVVSNPPYILESERETVANNVKNFEPPSALFVANERPLLFHDAIARSARESLTSGGLLITEINERLGTETAALFKSLGYCEVRIIKDLAKKNRFVSALQP